MERKTPMSTFEIELRYTILNPKQLTTFLLPFKKLGQKNDSDVYLDTQQALLYQKGIFIRIRNDKKLEIKFNRACLENPNLAIQDYCEEHSFALPLHEKDLIPLNALLISLNLKPIIQTDLEEFKAVNTLVTHYVIDKIRTSYTNNVFTLAIDEVTDLGTFLEIEFMASSIENLSSIKQQMLELLKDLDLQPLRTGYGTLLLRKKNFEHYLLGRFILEEDKKFRKPLQI